MKVTPTSLAEVLLIEPEVLTDDRGSFFESYNTFRYAKAGITEPFVQDNVSVSKRGVLRGLHFQQPHGQGKLVGVLAGEVFDVAVDVRQGSPNFRRWVGLSLSSENRHQLYVPPGFAHGFVVLSPVAVFAYKCTDFYHRESERCLRWNDPALGIEWPIADVTLNSRDRGAPTIDLIQESDLPRFSSSSRP